MCSFIYSYTGNPKDAKPVITVEYTKKDEMSNLQYVNEQMYNEDIWLDRESNPRPIEILVKSSTTELCIMYILLPRKHTL